MNYYCIYEYKCSLRKSNIILKSVKEHRTGQYTNIYVTYVFVMNLTSKL